MPCSACVCVWREIYPLWCCGVGKVGQVGILTQLVDACDRDNSNRALLQPQWKHWGSQLTHSHMHTQTYLYMDYNLGGQIDTWVELLINREGLHYINSFN